ncbi:MAG: nitrogenase component 1 [Planctomycetota bacterium]
MSVTTNACKLCAPLGACLAFRGVAGAMPFLHGSQGCSTYIRRYMIGHFREPMDIGSSNFGEQAAVFGGSDNFIVGINNIIKQYDPAIIGVATTCLSETIGDDMTVLIAQLREQADGPLPPLVHVSTPSYAGTHAEGFHRTVRALVEQLARPGYRGRHVVLMPGMVSPTDLRYLREILQSFDVPPVLLPDYSDSLDGPTWQEHHRIPEGGTTLEEIAATGCAGAAIGFGETLPPEQQAGSLLAKRFDVPYHAMDLPIGVRASDRFIAVLAQISGNQLPERHVAERGRLLDSYIDGHKYVFGKKAVIYGEEDLVAAMAGFLDEIGMVPAVCGTGGASGRLRARIEQQLGARAEDIRICDDTDFDHILAAAEAADVDLVIGHSKGYWLSRRLQRPLVRIGFPIHDRIGGARIAHLGYRGSQELYDRITNCIIEQQQDGNPVGYMAM